MSEKACDFVNTSGNKVEMLCINNKQEVTEKVISPQGNVVRPIFLTGHRYFYIFYNRDKWYLLR